MLKYALPIAIALGVAAPAFAQTEFFIVRGPDKKCKVVETRPKDTTVTIIGDRAYVTREEAQKQLTVVCKEKM
jgi:hypothetical protein